MSQPQSKSYFREIVCLECGASSDALIMASRCPHCGSAWLDARYDYAAVAPLWQGGLRDRVHSLWRYHELLPIPSPDPEITMFEGDTPLLRLYAYERLFNHPHLYVKDERQGPTSSFKDRQAAMAVTAMKQAGIIECVLASTGNAAAAYAAYCARADIKLWLFLTSLVPLEKMREAALYGAEVVKVSGTYDETKLVAAEFAARRGIHLDRGAKAIPGKESMKTLGFEIAEQLGLVLHPGERRWAAPDWYVQAVSGGIGPLGVWKAFTELYQMGLIDRLPKLGIIQAAGCAPMVSAFDQGRRTADAVVPQTLITVLATGDPGYSYTQLYDAIGAHGGAMMAIEDGETFAAMRRVASKAGLSVEPATAVAFAGLERLLVDGLIAPGESVVVNCSGHTFPAESHVLGDQYVLNLELNGHSASPARRQEDGLSAALQYLDEQVTTILIVDDSPNDRRLIRRLLKTYKSYRVFEARDGAEALRMVREDPPDLIVTDLTMPEMDGFSLIDTLKNNPITARIPIVVLSAKTLTEEDRRNLQHQSESVWLKGGFETRQLVDHIAYMVGDHSGGHTNTGVHEANMLPGRPRRGTAPLSEQRQVKGENAGRVAVIVDDNVRDLRLTRRMVEGMGGFRVIETTNGREGLKAIYQHRPELIVLDLILPDIDGISLVRILHNDPELREIPIVVYSGKHLSPQEYALLDGSIRLFIEKASIDKNQFISMISSVLRET